MPGVAAFERARGKMLEFSDSVFEFEGPSLADDVDADARARIELRFRVGPF